MIRECFKTKTGIMFDSEGLRSVGLDPTGLWPEVATRPAPLPVQGRSIQRIPPPPKRGEVVVPRPLATEEEYELFDALSPVYDQLSLAAFWWSLELVPMEQRYQKGDKSWQFYVKMNLGRGRFIPKQRKHGVKVHRSVKLRMDAAYEDGSKYKPRASFDKALQLGKVDWVD